jgi:uncharacterized protein
MTDKIQLTLNYDASIELLEKSIAEQCPGFFDYRILSKSLDARGANQGKFPRYQYSIEVINKDEHFTVYQEICPNIKIEYMNKFNNKKPIIIGAGPAGLFCALRLAEYGIPSIIIERGSAAHERMKHIARFWRYGEFDTEDNVCYGEGGAGLFSDGKLITRIKSPFVGYVMKKFVDFGAPKETAYVSNPHLGSNKIRGLISTLTDYLISKNCEIFYKTKVEEFLFEKKTITGVKTCSGQNYYSSQIILATGHSAKEMYSYLYQKNIALEHKDFAVGVRIEHPRSEIDKIQYGSFTKNGLMSSNYKLSLFNQVSDKGTYSFCMCPGGYVLSSGTDADGIVVNGMSNNRRNSPWSNSALVVTVQQDKDFKTEDILSGIHFQTKIEQKAFLASKEYASGKEVPAQMVKDFLVEKKSLDLAKTSCPSKIFTHQLSEIFPPFIHQHLQNALLDFNNKMKGFISDNALLLAPETRTSAPLTITRDKETLQSKSHKTLYPCGEGAGYAGGITSAAVDGIKVAESIVKEFL